VPAEKTCTGWTPGSRGSNQARFYNTRSVSPSSANFGLEGVRADTIADNTWNEENLAKLSGYAVDRVQTLIEGFFVPTATGYHTFTQGTDDEGEFWFAEMADAFCDTESELAKLITTSCCATTTNPNGMKYSKRVHLEKGKNYAYRFKHSEGGGGSYFYLGYIYHGANEFNIEGHGPFAHDSTTAGENQASERHEIRLRSHEQRENMAVEATGDAAFHLQWCNDNGVCKASSAMSPSSSQNTYKNTVQYMLDSQVEYTGSFDAKYQKTGNSKNLV